MLSRSSRLLRYFCTLPPKIVDPKEAVVKAPKLHQGQLQSFRFHRENNAIYEGYTPQELYGSKIGIKHSPAMRAEILKDSVAAILILAVTLGLVVLNLKSFARAISLAEKNYIHADTKYDETLFTILNKNKQSSDL